MSTVAAEHASSGTAGNARCQVQGAVVLTNRQHDGHVHRVVADGNAIEHQFARRIALQNLLREPTVGAEADFRRVIDVDQGQSARDTGRAGVDWRAMAGIAVGQRDIQRRSRTFDGRRRVAGVFKGQRL